MENKLNKIVEILEETGAKDLKVFDHEESSPFYRYVVVATANDRQANAAITHLTKAKLAETNDVEGNKASGWVLVDSSDIIIHLFTNEQREYYNLDEHLLGKKRVI